jgi:hypothetical protein
MRAKKMMVMALVLALATGASFHRLRAEDREGGRVISIGEDRPDLNFVGQFINNGLQSHQFGYISKIAGLDNVFNSSTVKNESTAMFTFSTYATTQQVVNNGTLRAVNRTGTTTIYYHPEGGATFADPASFEQGTPIQVSDYEQHVMLDTATAFPFVTDHLNTVTASGGFVLYGELLRLGRVHDAFRTHYLGKSNIGMPPPNGWFVGYAVGVRRGQQ